MKLHIQRHNKETSISPLNGVSECHELSFPIMKSFNKIFYWNMGSECYWETFFLNFHWQKKISVSFRS